MLIIQQYSIPSCSTLKNLFHALEILKTGISALIIYIFLIAISFIDVNLEYFDPLRIREMPIGNYNLRALIFSFLMIIHAPIALIVIKFKLNFLFFLKPGYRTALALHNLQPLIHFFNLFILFIFQLLTFIALNRFWNLKAGYFFISVHSFLFKRFFRFQLSFILNLKPHYFFNLANSIINYNPFIINHWIPSVTPILFLVLLELT